VSLAQLWWFENNYTINTTKSDKFIRLTKFLESRDDFRICIVYCAYGIPAMSLLDYGDCFILRVHEVRYVT